MPVLGLAAPCVTLSEAQAYVRVETGEEEALLAGLIRTATDLCEAFLGQVVISRSFHVDVAVSGRWERLDAGPVQSIDTVDWGHKSGALARNVSGAISESPAITIVGPHRETVTSPVGGEIVDGEARSSIDQILTALKQHGLIAS